VTVKNRIIGLLALLGASATALSAAEIITLTTSVFARIQDRPTLGGTGGNADVLNTSPGTLYVGDHNNNNDVYHVAYAFDLQGQDWSNLPPDSTFILRVQITGVTESGWPSISLWHVPNFSSGTFTTGVIVGGTLVATRDTSAISGNNSWELDFDVTSFVLSDIAAGNRTHAAFRLSPTSPLANNGNGVADRLIFSATPQIIVSSSQIPEPAHAALIGGVAAAAFPLLRRRRAG
jgi:hypothetical protein